MLDRLPVLKELLKVIALAAICITVPAAGWALIRLASDVNVSIPGPTYSELVSIVLTAVTVVLAVLTLIVGILAIWGYASIKKEAAGAARVNDIETPSLGIY